jgi:hypothetical protein
MKRLDVRLSVEEATDVSDLLDQIGFRVEAVLQAVELDTGVTPPIEVEDGRRRFRLSADEAEQHAWDVWEKERDVVRRPVVVPVAQLDVDQDLGEEHPQWLHSDGCLTPIGAGADGVVPLYPRCEHGVLPYEIGVRLPGQVLTTRPPHLVT